MLKLLAAGALAAVVLAAPAAAQNDLPDEDRADSTAAHACGTGRISHVFIDTHSIFDTSDPNLDDRVEWAYSLANRLHSETRPYVIRRELLFREGDCFDPERLEETERLLRALGFLSEVDVYGIPQEDGSYHVVVDTQDEWSTNAEVLLKLNGRLRFDGAQVSESNLLGTGQTVGLFYTDRSLARTYGVGYATPQLMGTRWDFSAHGGSTRAGTFFDESVSYPFVGELGRWAARQSFRRRDHYFDMVAAEAPPGAGQPPRPEIHLLLPVREKAMDVGLVKRFGRLGALSLIGGALSFQEISYPGGRDGSVLVLGSEFADSASAVDAFLDPIWSGLEQVQNIRAFVLLGHRSVGWIERSGLDALTAEQDVRVGSEFSLALGRSLPGLEADNDMFGTLTLFSGFGLGRSFVFSGEARLDARRALDAAVGTDEWRDVLGETRLLAYYRPTLFPRHTVLLRVAGAGGWNTVTPFQLTLGGVHSLRGFDDWRYPGGRRVVATMEDRYYLGWPWRDLLDLGLTGHLDVGRVWPGDLPWPYGVDSGWKASAGLGLRANFPAGGRTTYRLDLAVPLEAGGGLRHARLLFSIGEVVGLANAAGQPEVLRSRLSALAGDVFDFPR